MVVSVLLSFAIIPWLPMFSVSGSEGSSISGNVQAQVVRSEDRSSQSREEMKTLQAIEDYEKEKLAKYRRSIGKRFLAVRTVRPPEFYESPDDLTRKMLLKEKEEFQIVDVVRNESGTMYFYKVKLEGRRIGYLGADGNNLEIRTKDGSLIPLTPKTARRGESSREQASRAIDLVKNEAVPSDPASKDKRSIERRMLELRATSFPKLKWRYEAKPAGSGRYRVTQIVEGESDRPILRTWLVDPSRRKVSPENEAAKALYRY